MQGFYKVVLQGFIPCGVEGLGRSPKAQARKKKRGSHKYEVCRSHSARNPEAYTLLNPVMRALITIGSQCQWSLLGPQEHRGRRPNFCHAGKAGALHICRQSLPSVGQRTDLRR